MQHKYSTKILSRTALGVVQGELYEGDTLIATFKKPINRNGGWSYTKMRFGSDAAAARFEDFCDSLTRGETLEALSAHQEPK